jgi:hypothetical protein
VSYLSLLLVIKIVVTTFSVVIPFTLFSPTWLKQKAGISTDSPLLLRLYGAAIAALLVGYGFGVPVANRGQLPQGVMYMGLASNIGAAFLLLKSSKTRITFILGIFFALIAAGLIIALSRPDFALSKLHRF